MGLFDFFKSKPVKQKPTLNNKVNSNLKNPLLFIDCEWANNKNKSICQIALIYRELGKKDIEQSYYVNPNDSFDPNCVAVHHISKNKVSKCDTFDKIWSKIEHYFTNSIIIGHNVSNADLNAIIKNLQRYEINIPELYYIDTYTLSRNLISNYDIDNYNLSSLCDYFNIELENYHDAMCDTKACSKLFDVLVENYNFELNKHINKFIPNKAKFVPYIYSSEFKREINLLLGTIKGIEIDKKINEKEVNFLIEWRNKHKEYENIDEIYHIIKTIDLILEDYIITSDELSAFKSIISNYVNNSKSSKETLATQELQGIITGIMVDGKIEEMEIIELQNWLYDNEFLKGHFPYNILLDEVNSILEDNVVTDYEIESLEKTFKQILNPIDEINSQIIEFEGNSFCLSGDFDYGSKTEVENYIISKGGVMHKAIKKTTSYLVLGNSGSQRYSNGNYGTKYKKAKDYNIPILKETQLFE